MWIVALLLLAAGILVWIISGKRGSDTNVDEMVRRARSPLAKLIGIPIERVRDVRLAAVTLMLQVARTGSPVTAAEKSRILEFMRDPLEVEAISAMYEVAWSYTQARRPFPLLAGELLPLLRETLTPDERLQLVDMLIAVASAHSEMGELQHKAITQFREDLMAASPALKASRAGDSGR
ncbi:tellurite resistance TerB family protein [Methylobacterium marchantiae]|uniref:TerB family tellurite resistance protein n=1 Tax=Methylobacterium marchantiae TaxID=600331 RepID=A0ABW3WVT1_9HYPH|nr:hypothetical protein AIGOOFII_1509 [Methylobacterium marchantiae]